MSGGYIFILLPLTRIRRRKRPGALLWFKKTQQSQTQIQNKTAEIAARYK